MTIADIIGERGIEEVLHYTTSDGVLGILDCAAVKSRFRLQMDKRLEYILRLNTPVVKDKDWVDYVNLSITWINCALFDTSSTRWHPGIRWAVLCFTPEILSHDGVIFCTTNNAYHAVVERGKGPDGLEAMFGVRIPWGHYGSIMRRPSGMPANRPTDMQAEVLYPKELSTSLLRMIYVPDGETADDVAGMIRATGHREIDVIVAPDRFERPEGM